MATPRRAHLVGQFSEQARWHPTPVWCTAAHNRCSSRADGLWNGISQDVTSKLTNGRSYTTSVWVRTQSGTPGAKVTLRPDRERLDLLREPDSCHDGECLGLDAAVGHCDCLLERHVVKRDLLRRDDLGHRQLFHR